MSQPSENVTRALIGNRRAHQYLRLLDLGRRSQAAELLDGIEGQADAAAAAAEFVFMGGTLRSVSDSIATRLPDVVREEVAAKQEELLARRSALFLPGELRAWVEDSAAEALRVTTLLWPNRKVRVSFFEASAKSSFESEEPGSHVRRTVFGEDASGESAPGGQ